MKLFLQGRYTIIGECHFSEEDDVICLNVPIEDALPVEVKIRTKERHMEAYQEVEVDQHCVELLEADLLKRKKRFDDDISVFNDKNKHLSFAVNKTIYGIKLFFNWGGLDKNLIPSRGDFWSIDNQNWFNYPRRMRGYVSSRSFTTLSKRQLDSQGSFEPFLGSHRISFPLTSLKDSTVISIDNADINIQLIS